MLFTENSEGGKAEGLNPRISCGFSRDTQSQPENHAPVGVSDPYAEIKLDTANQGL